MATRRSRPPGVSMKIITTGLRTLDAVSPSLAARWASDLFFTPPPPMHTERARRVLSTGKRFTVPFGRRCLVAWRWGQGPAVYLMHGWGGRSSQLGDFVPPLVEAGYTVIAFDAPAHGASPGRRSSLPQFGRALRAMVEATGPAWAVVAHSMGGPSTVFALQEGLNVERLVFLAPPAAPFEFTEKFARRIGLSPRTLNRLQQRIEERVGVRWSDLSVTRIAPEMTTPLLIFHDRDDADTPWTGGKAIADAWPGAVLVTTTGLGHRKILRDPAVVEQAVAFVSRGRQDQAPGLCQSCGALLLDPWDDSSRCCCKCSLEADLFYRDAR